MLTLKLGRLRIGLAGWVVLLAVSTVLLVRPFHSSARQTGGKPRGPNGVAPGPSFYRDVLPILQQHCENCHRAGGIAPMSFETYEGAWGDANAIRGATRD